MESSIRMSSSLNRLFSTCTPSHTMLIHGFMSSYGSAERICWPAQTVYGMTNDDDVAVILGTKEIK